MTYGELSAQGDLRTLHFERHYDATVEEVWAAISDSDRVARWLLCDAKLEPVVGGTVFFRWEGEDGGEVNGVVSVCEPPRLLEYSWREGDSESVVRFELLPSAGGVSLVLDHRRIAKRAVAGMGAGWHSHLDALAASLAGQPFEWWPRFNQLQPDYEELAAKL
jgi:uncharacterized protein YndB with AHSA1/START domain